MSIFLDNWLLSRAHRVYCPIAGSTARSFGAGHLFDEMSIWRSTKRQSMETAVAGHEDRISTLPDELLQYMMSFLLSRDAVRTCVLAKRWRALWKSVPALRIGDIESYHSVHSFSRFVDELLRLRDPAPMHECEIRSNYMQNNDEVFQSMLLSIQYALSCQVQVLRVSFRSHAENMTFVSSHLKSLKLCHIWFWDCSIDFSRCQVLEELEMENCGIFENIFSPSLRHLNINGGCTQSGSCTRISTPHLIGLKLGDFWGLTPLLDRMPSLVTASITLGKDCRDLCYIYCGGNPKCTGCNGHPGNSNCSVVLEGLSGATNLELTASHPNVVCSHFC